MSGNLVCTFLFDMTGQEKKLDYHKGQCQAEAAEYLEIHPDGFEGKGHVKICRTQQDEKYGPAGIEACPDGIGQAYGMIQHASNQQLLANEPAGQERQTKCPVHDGGLPFQVGFFMECQGQGAKQQDGNECYQLVFFQIFLFQVEQAVDNDRGNNQHCGGAEDASEFKLMPAQADEAGINLVDNEKNQQWQEIDKLFHG